MMSSIQQFYQDCLVKFALMGWNPLFVEAMQKREYVGYLLDTLLTGTKEEKAAVIKGHGKEVERIERRVSEFAGGGKTSRGNRHREPER